MIRLSSVVFALSVGADVLPVDALELGSAYLAE
jgi:hypothetical protein